MMRRVLIALLTLLIGVSVAHAQASRQQAPKSQARFDYYLLSMSWSPTYCAEEDNAARDPRQCGRERPFAFVVHGLWPQYDAGGWPEDCPTMVREVPAPLVTSMLDIMPSPRLVAHEWRKHGACTGLSPQAYFDMTRRARAAVRIPPAYVAPRQTLMVTGAEVERAFVAANPGWTPAMVAVQCDDRRLREVRVYLTRDGRPRACARDVRDRCGPQKVAMPPVR